MNRKNRRAAKAAAERTAELLARSVCDIGPGGLPVRITDPQAIKLLARGFLHSMRHNLAPHLMRVSPEVARTFPRYGRSEAAQGEGWSYWLAVGFDRLGRGTFLLKPVLVEGVEDPTALRRILEARLFGELREHLQDTAPIPAGAA